MYKSTPMIDDTKQNRRNQGQETVIKEEVIDIFFFNIWLFFLKFRSCISWGAIFRLQIWS